ncbi:MAG TPA: alpha-glucosidase C-terminal domain-containing protein, partial [Gemmata sp.]|nr:alpha-glucosidase C-terminal domain-containing protein [Gemmata sp.]
TARINLGIRHRLAPLLRNDRRRIELMNALLFSLPGTPVIYYGDEIGMGDNIYLGDRRGVRTPMQWSSDRNAGFSRANPQKLFLPIIIDPEYHYEAVNVDAQQNNSSSLLWWMKRLIALRKQFKAFGRGTIKFVRPENSKALAFLREFEEERILVVANLSRFVQFVRLDLHDCAGVTPVELFGRTQFAPIADSPYVMTLSPHAFYWLLLPSQPVVPAVAQATDTGSIADRLPRLRCDRGLASLFARVRWDDLEALIPRYLQRRGTENGGEPMTTARILDAFPLVGTEQEIWLLIVQLEFRSGLPETISLPLTCVAEEDLPQILGPVNRYGFAAVSGNVSGVLCYALAVPACCRGLLNSIQKGNVVGPDNEQVAALPFPADRPIESLPPDAALTMRQSHKDNALVVFGESFIYKVFHQVEEGTNPDLEIGRVMTAAGFTGAPEVVGYTEYRQRGSEPATLGVLHRYVAHQSTAWQYTLDHLSGYFERVAAFGEAVAQAPPKTPLIDRRPQEPADVWHELIGSYLEMCRIIAHRTAEMHTLLSRVSEPGFTVEPFGKLYQRSLYQSLRTLLGRLCRRLQQERASIPQSARPHAERLLAAEPEILAMFGSVLDPGLGGYRIRCHGNYLLEQLFFTGKDFVVIDFEGEPGRTIGERRLKKSPLHDVATLVRSFDYAAQSAFLGLSSKRGRAAGLIRDEDRELLSVWSAAWYARVASEYVTEYVGQMNDAKLLPRSEDRLQQLLNVLILERAMREIDLELTHRPDWLIVPLRSVVRMLGYDPNHPAVPQ